LCTTQDLVVRLRLKSLTTREIVKTAYSIGYVVLLQMMHLESSVAIRLLEIYQERTRQWYALKARTTCSRDNEREVMRKRPKRLKGAWLSYEI
jgi:hypothetical protein